MDEGRAGAARPTHAAATEPACAVAGAVSGAADDERFMREALVEAREAAAAGEVPVGAVVVYEGRVIARGRNRREQDADPSAHAEFSAMVAAARELGRWRLTGCTVYVTLEPCAMCAGLMVNARIDRCVYGAADPKGGALGSLYELNRDDRLNHAFEVTPGVLADACAHELRAFFAVRRGASDAVSDGGTSALVPEAEPGATPAPTPSPTPTPTATPAAPRASHPARATRPLRALLAIDSFKGSATSAQAEAWVAEGMRRVDPQAQLTCLPVGDGGEGTADALAAAQPSRTRTLAVADAFGRPTEATYLLMEGDEPAAYIEMAEAAGLACSDRTEEAARVASTRGVGELVLDAIARGVRTVYLGLGGSATNDGGAGFLQALGARLLDGRGEPVGPGLDGVAEVATIDLAPAYAALGGARLVALSDVTNPLVGPRGALHVFGPQKGLPRDEAALDTLDRGMVAYGALLGAACRALVSPPFRSLAGVPGAGAAGGLGAAVLALGGSLTSGIDAVLDLVGFDGAVRAVDFVVTGEGMMDGQTAGGKAPLGIARRARAAGRPVVAVVGGRADDLSAVYGQGIDLVLPIVRRPMSLDDALTSEEARANLICTGEAVARAWRFGR